MQAAHSELDETVNVREESGRVVIELPENARLLGLAKQTSAS